MNKKIFLGLALSGFSLLGCNPYKPSLGDTPFRCGSSEPKCPEGYQCVVYSDVDQICEAENAVRVDAAPEPDAEQFVCSNDSEVEPNDTSDEAVKTHIPTDQDTFRLVGLAICPDSDKDFYEFDVVADGGRVRIDLEHIVTRGQLVLELQNENGGTIAEAEPLADMPNTLRLEAVNLATGKYYALVRAPLQVENNYSIEVIFNNF